MWYNMPINIEIIKFIQAFSSSFLDKVFLGITMLGEEYFFITVITLIYWCINKDFGYRLGFTLLSNNVLNGVIKMSLKVPRPFGEEGIRSLRVETATGYSFPSGHTQGATSFWVSIMKEIKRKWIYIFGCVMIFLIGISRLYLGVHRPVDVIGGALFATIWVFVANWIFDLSKKYNKGIFLIIIIPMAISMYFLRDPDYFKASGTVIGFYIGYIIEQRYIKFNVKTDALKQVLKYVIGISMVILIKVFIKKILPIGIIWDFIRYILISLWVTIGAPLLFKIFFKSRSEKLKSRLIGSI